VVLGTPFRELTVAVALGDLAESLLHVNRLEYLHLIEMQHHPALLSSFQTISDYPLQR
jgi:hypothetical protein